MLNFFTKLITNFFMFIIKNVLRFSILMILFAGLACGRSQKISTTTAVPFYSLSVSCASDGTFTATISNFYDFPITCLDSMEANGGNIYCTGSNGNSAEFLGAATIAPMTSSPPLTAMSFSTSGATYTCYTICYSALLSNDSPTPAPVMAVATCPV